VTFGVFCRFSRKKGKFQFRGFEQIVDFNWRDIDSEKSSQRIITKEHIQNALADSLTVKSESENCGRRPIFKACSKCDSKSASAVESFMNGPALPLLWQRCQKSDDKEKTAASHHSSFCGIDCHERGTIFIPQSSIIA
jgi:hypothetical protein